MKLLFSSTVCFSQEDCNCSTIFGVRMFCFDVVIHLKLAILSEWIIIQRGKCFKPSPFLLAHHNTHSPAAAPVVNDNFRYTWQGKNTRQIMQWEFNVRATAGEPVAVASHSCSNSLLRTHSWDLFSIEASLAPMFWYWPASLCRGYW